MAIKPDIILRAGKPTAVILDIKDFEELLERLEDLADLKRLRTIRKQKTTFKSLSRYLAGRKRRV